MRALVRYNEPSREGGTDNEVKPFPDQVLRPG